MAAEWQRPLNWSPNGKVFFPLRLRIRRSVEPPPVPRSTAQQPGPLANQQLLWSPLSPKAGGATENQILIARSATTRCPAARPFQARARRGSGSLARGLVVRGRPMRPMQRRMELGVWGRHAERRLAGRSARGCEEPSARSFDAASCAEPVTSKATEGSDLA